MLGCLHLAVVISSLLFGQPTVSVRGRVLDSLTGEPLSKALVSVRAQNLETQTDASGAFVLSGVTPGEVELYVSTVGYGLFRRTVSVPGDRDLDLEVRLGQDAVRRSDEVTVTAGPFEPIDPGAPSELTLNNSELRNLGAVVVDDPLRSVQSLPGVSTGDDFNAQFAVRGSGFRSIGFYVDGVLTTTPFHGVRDINDGGSLSVLNGDIVDSVSFLSGAPPAKYGDRTGAVLSIDTRDGSRERTFHRINAAASGLSYTGEGPIGASRRASWLVSARKSYLDWLIRRLSEDPEEAAAFGYSDVHTRLSFDPTASHHWTLGVVIGDSGLTRERERDRLSANSVFTGNSQTAIVNLGWRWLISPHAVVSSRVYLNQDSARNQNRSNELLYDESNRHLAVRSDGSFQASVNQLLEGGVLVRHLRQQEQRRRFDFNSGRFLTLDDYTASSWQPGAYVQHTWRVREDRVSLVVGGRFDRFGYTRQNVWLPRFGLSTRVASNTRLAFGYGQLAQFPDLPQLLGVNATPGLRAERSTHYVLSIDQPFGERTRLRVEFYNQEERSRIFSVRTSTRLEQGQIVLPQRGPVLENSVRGYSRGVEISLQRRSANRLSGWVSYAYSHSRLRDLSSNLHFDSDFDQRHTANVYGSYRLTSTLNASVKYRYGSNFPAPAFLSMADSRFFVSSEKNRVRLPAYSRLDLRVNKAFHYRRWKLTLYGEVTNVLGTKNYRYTDFNSFNFRTGQVFVSRDTLLPFLPVAGMTIEF